MNEISIAAARGNFLTWCVGGNMPLDALCRPLYVAQKLDAAPAVVGEYSVFYSAEDAAVAMGPGSVAALMAEQHFNTCPELPLYIAPIADDGAGVAAQHTITLAGTATESGVLSIAILDKVYQVAVIVGATAASVATALDAILDADPSLPVTSVPAAGVITTTAKNKGTVGNWFVPVVNPNVGDAIPAGLTVAVANTVAGVGVLSVAPILGVFNCPWDVVALGFGNQDQAAVDVIIQQIRNDWACGVQGLWQGGHVFFPVQGTAGQIAAYGLTRNDPEASGVPVEPDYKYPGFVLTAAVASRASCSACSDPSRPIQYDNGVMGNLFDSRPCASIWSGAEKRAFHDAGVLVWDVASSSGLRNTALVIEEPLTFYKINPLTGGRDGVWERVEYRFTISKFTKDLGAWYRLNYSSISIVDDGTRIPAGKKAIGPWAFKASVLAWIRSSQWGWTIEGTPAELEARVTVTRPVSPNRCDPSRFDVAIDADLVNQLARIATSINVSPQFSCRAAA
jgi:phage tail sheath gpL-like